MAGVAAWASKDVVAKLLGPTADYLGGEIAKFAEKCNINIGRIFANAARKLGPALETPGAVNPRVLKGVLDDGAFTEDEVAAEYFGGILAASRSDDSKDDRAVSVLATIRGLSSYELRLHYVFYQSLYKFVPKPHGNLRDRDEIASLGIFIPRESLRGALQLPASEYEKVMVHALAGLRRASLLNRGSYGEHYIKKDYLDIGDGFVAEPSLWGAQVFLWAHGRHDLNPNVILGGADLPDFPGVMLPQGVRSAVRREMS